MGIEALNGGSMAGIGAGVPGIAGEHGAFTDVDALVAAARTSSPLDRGIALRALDTRTGDPQLTDAAVRDGAAPSGGAAAGAGPAERCVVEVRFKPVIGPTNHAFIVTRDADSTNYFRGGPQANDTGVNSPGSGSGSDGADRAAFNSRFGIYGPIVTDYRAYRQGTVDWTTEPSGRQTVTNLPGNCDAIETTFARHMDDIEAARINYEPLSANSNSVVRETLERSGFPDVSPIVWAPAWDAQLADPR